MGTMALLEHEVYHMEDAGSYGVLPSLVSIESSRNIDLILGTQVCAVT